MNVASFLSNVRQVKAPLAVVVLYSIVATQVPLFNYLGFEFSALSALLLGFLAGIVTISQWKKHEIPPSAGPSDGEEFWRYLQSLALSLAMLAVLPAVVMTANALFVKNCSFTQGLMFYGLLVLPGVLFCSSVALLISVSSFRWKKTWFTLLYGILLFHIVFVTFTRPQIFAFNPVIGFFPGITYDETMQVEGRLLIYRWATVAASLFLFICAVVLYRYKRQSGNEHRAIGRRKLLYKTELFGAAVLVVIVSGVFMLSDRLGLSSPRSHIEEELGGRVETRHFVIYYPASMVDEGQAQQLARLHEFYFTKLAEELRVVVTRKVRSFLYPSSVQKARLIGAGRTNIAKPWLWQIHLNLGDVESSLKHEMVHVLAADFGFPLIRVGLNPGLIEGLATAVERVQYEEPLHRVAAQILSVGVNPRMEQLFSFTGFAGAYSGVSYTLAGSFSRFLIDRYGLRKFKLLYRSGEFGAIYRKDIAVLLDEWHRHLERYAVDTSAQQKAAYYFKRASIFGKECARVIANMNSETRRYFSQGEFQKAYESATRSLELSRNSEAISQTVNALSRMGKSSEVIGFMEEQLEDSLLAHTLLPLTLQLGDSYWATGEIEKARQLYTNLLSTHLSSAMDEAAALRLEVLRDTRLARTLLPYFTGTHQDTTRISMLQASLRTPERKDLKTYLLAREHATRGDDRLAVELFHSVGKLNRDVLEFQRQLRLARMYYTLGEFQRAKIHFWQSLNYTSSESFLFRIQEWVDRCDWMVRPLDEIFEHKEGELQSRLEPESPCGCEPQQAVFLPVPVN